MFTIILTTKDKTFRLEEGPESEVFAHAVSSMVSNLLQKVAQLDLQDVPQQSKMLLCLEVRLIHGRLFVPLPSMYKWFERLPELKSIDICGDTGVTLKDFAKRLLQ